MIATMLMMQFIEPLGALLARSDRSAWVNLVIVLVAVLLIIRVFSKRRSTTWPGDSANEASRQIREAQELARQIVQKAEREARHKTLLFGGAACPRCGSEHTGRFCARCGHRMEDDEPRST